MAVYDGVPSIRLEGDEKRALALIPEAKALLYKVQTFLKTAELNTFSMSRRIDDDSYIYVLSANGQNIIHISVSPEVVDKVVEPEPALANVSGTLFPDFYSGIVFRGYLEDRTKINPDGTTTHYKVCSTFAPTQNCADMHPALTVGRQSVGRLAVRPSTELSELENPNQNPVFTQYTKLRPSMYSGTMKKVVQIVMGLGRIAVAKMRDPASTVSDSQYLKDVDTNGVQVRYDYKFVRTHGITRAIDGRLWLVEISISRGVLARPLPLFPSSDSLGFRTRAETRGDTAMVAVLDELGCLPTGESFPAASAQLNELLASGKVLRLLEPAQLTDFYNVSAYSSALGWAFSDSGVEAHNTGYYFGEDGLQRGVWYQINLNIGAINPDWVSGQPIAAASAELRKISEGFLYCPPLPPSGSQRFVPIKFHEPLLPGLLSHEGVPSGSGLGLPPPKVDTVMFVAFDDGELKAVKYYRNPLTQVFNNIDDPRYDGECLVANTWEITETSGTRGFPSMMYSNEFDDRKVLQDSITKTTITSNDQGYDPPSVSDVITDPSVAHIARQRVFKRTTSVDSKVGEAIYSVVAVPQYSREAYYYAVGGRYEGGHSGSISVGYDYLLDPNTGWSFRCFPGGAGTSYPSGIGCDKTLCGATCPAFAAGVHSERRIVCRDYENYDCAEFADSGPWLEICQNVDPFLLGVPPIRIPTTTSWDLGSDEWARLYIAIPGYGGPLQLDINPSDMAAWVRPSPDIAGNVQSISAGHSAIGLNAVICSTGMDSSDTRVIGYTPTPVLASDSVPCFVGVNAP